jgi:hypothetical protein
MNRYMAVYTGCSGSGMSKRVVLEVWQSILGLTVPTVLRMGKVLVWG